VGDVTSGGDRGNVSSALSNCGESALECIIDTIPLQLSDIRTLLGQEFPHSCRCVDYHCGQGTTAPLASVQVRVTVRPSWVTWVSVFTLPCCPDAEVLRPNP